MIRRRVLAVVLLLLAALGTVGIFPAHAQPGFFNTAQSMFTNNGGTVTVVIPNVLAGDLLIVSTATWRNAGSVFVISLTDGVSTTYTRIGTADGNTKFRTELWSGVAPSSSSSLTVTIGFTNTGLFGVAEVTQYEGFNVNSNSGFCQACSGTSISVSTANPIGANSIAFAEVGFSCTSGIASCLPSGPKPVWTPSLGTVRDSGADSTGTFWHSFLIVGDVAGQTFSGTVGSAAGWGANIVELVPVVNYSLSNSSLVYVQAGTIGAVSVKLVWNFGPTATVTLACSGLPAGFSCSFGGPVTIGQSSPTGVSTLSITVLATVAVGQYSFSVAGTPTGSPAAIPTVVSVYVTHNLGIAAIAMVLLFVGAVLAVIFYSARRRKKGGRFR